MSRAINYLPAHPEKEQHYKAYVDFDSGLAEADPIYFAQDVLGLTLNPFQKRALISAVSYKQFMWVTSNQIGKTVALSILHIYWNYFKIGISGSAKILDKAQYQTLNISPISRQSQLAAKYVEDILNSQFTWEIEQEDGSVDRFVNKCKIGWFFKGKDIQQGRFDFDNNSCLYCLSTASDQGSGLQGTQFAKITYDECAQSLHLEEELPARIVSRTAKYAGSIGLVATPDDLAKSQQYWYGLYTQAEREMALGEKPEWFLVKGVYDENIFITEEKREEFKKRLLRMSPERYKQVVLGQFLASSNRMFPPEVIEGMWDRMMQKKPVKENHKYVICVDWGVADAGDETVMLVADVTDLDNPEIVNHFVKQGGDPVELMSTVSMFWLEYNYADVTMDTAEMGGVIFKKMLSHVKPISYGKENKTDALLFLQIRLRNNLKPNYTDEQKKLLTNERINSIGKLKGYYIAKLEAQLSNYKLDDQKIKQDWVMALSQLAWYCSKYKASRKIEVFSLKNFYSSNRK